MRINLTLIFLALFSWCCTQTDEEPECPNIGEQVIRDLQGTHQAIFTLKDECDGPDSLPSYCLTQPDCALPDTSYPVQVKFGRGNFNLLSMEIPFGSKIYPEMIGATGASKHDTCEERRFIIQRSNYIVRLLVYPNLDSFSIQLPSSFDSLCNRFGQINGKY
jgi:hypothetical protein